jgi:hypothetical protein
LVFTFGADSPSVRSRLRYSRSMKVVAVTTLALALMGCTITPEAIIGLVAGETAGAFVAGPLGAALGAGIGVVAASMVVWPTVLAIFVYYLSPA